MTVTGYSACEAAARALDKIIEQGGRITDLQVVEQIPGREFTINPKQVLKYASTHATGDNLGLRQIKQRVREKLKPSG